MAAKYFTAEQAHNVARRLSRRIHKGTCVVTYDDPKNNRIVLNIYSLTPDNLPRILRQIATFKATVFERGLVIDAASIELLDVAEAGE